MATHLLIAHIEVNIYPNISLTGHLIWNHFAYGRDENHSFFHQFILTVKIYFGKACGKTTTSCTHLVHCNITLFFFYFKSSRLLYNKQEYCKKKIYMYMRRMVTRLLSAITFRSAGAAVRFKNSP